MKSRHIGLCLVCNDAAVGINFGVPTCMPCKAFFRRNAVKLGTIDFICQEDGDCPVTYESRRICNCCRLAKCFRVGMQKSLILSDAQRLARKELVQQNRLKRGQSKAQNLSLVHDKIRLLRNHFGGMITMNELMLARCMHEKAIASINNIFGFNLAKDIIEASERILPYTYDPILLKLILIVRSLSSGINRYRKDTDMDRIFNNTLAVFAGQSVYVELLWRYIMSKVSSEQDAVKFFNKLILDLLYLQRSCFAIERNMYRLGHEIEQMKPLMQSMWPRIENIDEIDYDNDMDMEPCL
ncbi:unnamed protein product [Rotaria sp. Silwood1]|nr:unnamed protein product [Rotaria sp. Silwood1]CAF0839005.1 unnamed protein product [Rotaria sp. Silwood1]CAF3340816.1 unnamed protein product [Rotaria sp. Silwood1]